MPIPKPTQATPDHPAYTVVYLRNIIASDKQAEILNEMAAQGWRLVSVDGGWGYFEWVGRR